MYYASTLRCTTRESRDEWDEFLLSDPAGRRPHWASEEGTEMSMDDIAALTGGLVRSA